MTTCLSGLGGHGSKLSQKYVIQEGRERGERERERGGREKEGERESYLTRVNGLGPGSFFPSF